MELGQAVTININPASFVTIPVKGKMVRKKWVSHTVDDQQFFLGTFLSFLQRYGVKTNDVLIRYESTDKGCRHVHMTIPCSKGPVESAKNDFCAMVQRNMPEEIKDRCVKIVAIYHTDGWNDYVIKEDNRDSDDEPIEDIKMPTHNIMRRHIKK